MKAHPVKHLIAHHSLRRSSSRRCCHLPLILWLFFPSSLHFLPSLTVFPPQRIHPKFNYFRGGFSKRNGALSQRSRGPELAPRNASTSHTRTQTISAIYDLGSSALLQLARWLLRWWFIQISHFRSLLLCHTFSRAVHTEEPGAQFWTWAISDVSGWLFISL